VRHFWRALRAMPQKDRAAVLRFVTGSSKVPLDGYVSPPFTITEDCDADAAGDMAQRLPHSHTCFNQLVLPPYRSEALLRTKLLFAARETAGFHMS